MKVFFHPDFYQSYTYDPAAAIGRMEAIVGEIKDLVTFEEPPPASEEDIAACHGSLHITQVKREGLYEIAALAAGGAIAAAETGLKEPAFALIRPPGHHASRDSAWGFCYFNNMAIALERLKRTGRIKTAKILDFDLHFGDGTVNILGGRRYVSILNPSSPNRNDYLKEVEKFLFEDSVDIIGISAGFDNHLEDWGGLLHTEDYREMGKMAKEAARQGGGGCFAILEGGYNHRVLGKNCRALLEGLMS
ncbi:MAG TPA: histone deacetylase family protein [Syntrophales bacterium]|mgnify:CR=1 FL=1|nr:histone deacetylase family protein [Syntrophales bacterium]HOL58274.1 histone deacetylase family protein [Syntrophales bacterium]HPO34443.1 histone deacetylase family protein [Syntrophales bacterium]